MEGLSGHPVRRRRPRSRGGTALSRRIVLLRHGRTAYNASGVIQGQLDPPLDDAGRRQAQAVAQVFAPWPPSVLLTSDLTRATATADAVGAACGVASARDARLRELHLGRWQGLTSEQARERFPDEWRAWRSGRDVARGGGERYADAGERAAAAVLEGLVDVAPGGYLLAVTHGGTARAALGRLLELDVASWGRLAPLGNGCWSTLVEADWGWRLERHGAGLGPPVGPADGAHDLGGRPSRLGTVRGEGEPVR